MALPPELQQGLLGSWSGSYRVWLEPGAEPSECETAATCAPELDDRFVVYRYDWSYDGAPQHGHALLGCTDDGDVPDGVDRHVAQRQRDHVLHRRGPEPIVTGTYAEDRTPAVPWHWRTEFTFAGADRSTVAAYNITPAGEEMMATEARYTKR